MCWPSKKVSYWMEIVYYCILLRLQFDKSMHSSASVGCLCLTILPLWWHQAHWAHEALRSPVVVTSHSPQHSVTSLHPGGENWWGCKFFYFKNNILRCRLESLFYVSRHPLHYSVMKLLGLLPLKCLITKADNCKTSPYSKSMVVNKSQDNHISIFCRIPYALMKDSYSLTSN